MAWESFIRNGVEITSGDQPIDELALALKKVANLYEERWDRKPMADEIMYAMETVICSQPDQFVVDPDGLQLADFVIKREGS